MGVRRSITLCELRSVVIQQFGGEFGGIPASGFGFFVGRMFDGKGAHDALDNGLHRYLLIRTKLLIVREVPHFGQT
jgi:hypothetical protein